MTKYLVDVYLPAAGEHYDVFLPAGKQIGEVTTLLVKAAQSLSNGNYQGTNESVLLDAISGKIYDRNITVFDAGIRNASKLVLI